MLDICRHDQLRRSCELCERDEQIEQLLASVPRPAEAMTDEQIEAARDLARLIISHPPIVMDPAERAQMLRQAILVLCFSPRELPQPGDVVPL